MWNEFRQIKGDTRTLKNFGFTVGTILIIFSAVAAWRGKAFYPYALLPGIILVVCGAVFPQILKIPNKIWMGFAIVIGFFMSRIILSILFYLVMTPMGLATKLIGKDILDKRIDKSAVSYWKTRTGPALSKESYEKQF